jgi:CRP-like cAMP-binding protein
MTATPVKLAVARAEARALLQARDYAQALRAYDRILAAMPFDYEVRFKIGDLLAKVGLAEEAAQVYRTVATHDIKTGHPLPAVIACRALEELGKPAHDLLALLVQTYAAGSPLLARFAVRPAPVDPDTTLELPPIDPREPFDAAAARACARALDLSNFVTYQQQFHPLPFLSELGADALLAVLRLLTVHRLEDGAAVVRQGDPGQSLFLVAAGELRVHMRLPDGRERELARLFENTLFGEMALLANQPRLASVTVVGDADLVEVRAEALAQVTQAIPAVREALDRFARERLIKNLLATSPLFTPFSKAQQADLLRRFEGLESEPGAELIVQGEPGRGLYVVLSGELEVTARGPEGPVVLGRLGMGDIFGEMSLLTHQPASASVRALGKCTLLFLARTYVDRLAAAVPEVASYFAQVAERRARDNSARLSAAALPEEAVELDASDVIML